MTTESKYKIGDYVYFLDKKKGIRGGRITSEMVKNAGWYDEVIIYTIKGYDTNFKEDELFDRRCHVLRSMLIWLCVDEYKINVVSQYLFPDEVTEADFNTVAPKPLQITEKTGFFKKFFK